MNFFDAEKSDIQKLLRYGKTEAGWFYNWLQKSHGVINDDWEHVAPYLTLCRYTENLKYSPKILLVHSKAGQRSIFGDKWADNVVFRDKIPDVELSKNASYGFVEALNRQPVIEEVQTVLNSQKGPEIHTYARIISVVENRLGQKFFAFYGTPLHRVLQRDEHDRQQILLH